MKLSDLELPQRDALARYAALIRSWAPRTNLISAGDLDRLEDRHIGDSLRALEAVTAVTAGPAIDVGSGAGLPGIPLAVADPSRHWTLLEPRSLRVQFLREVVQELALANVRVLKGRVEKLAQDPHAAGSFALGTARAFAPPEVAVKLLRPLIAPGGTCLIFVGPTALRLPEAEEAAPGIVRVVVDGGFS